MSLSFSNRIALRSSLVTAFVIAMAACSGEQPTSAHQVPVGNGNGTSAQTVATLQGTVRPDGSVLIESLDPSVQVGDSNVSGAIYGNQNVTARVSISAFTLDSTATTKTWTFKLAVHNLLNFPIGSLDGATAPSDTVGLYAFFPSAPSVVSPAACGCAVSVMKTQGTAAFTAPNQQYYWYHDRLAAKGLAGDSTTHIPTWTFTAPKAVTSFRFFIILSSPFPRGLQTTDTTWSVFYNPVSDSLPDVNAKPIWKRIGQYYGGSYSASVSGLSMTLPRSGGVPNDMFFYRSDNLNRLDNAYIEAKLTMPSAGGGNPVMLLALADSVKFVGLGIGAGKIGFATFNQNTLKWEWSAGATLSVSTTGTHTYRVGKFGATNATVYMDGVEKFTAANSLLPATFFPAYGGFIGPQAADASTFFGPTSQDAAVQTTVSYVTYAFHATPKP